MPIPIKINIPSITNDDWVKAAVIAVPTKGAEHGVARIVAKKPLKKSLVKLLLFKFWIDLLFTNWGILNSNKPNKFKENTNKIIAIISKNIGSWNCIPHTILTPINLNKIRIIANIVKDVIIPSEVIKKLFLIEISLSIFLRIDKILIDKIGKTQGIAFKIIPPIKLITKI